MSSKLHTTWRETHVTRLHFSRLKHLSLLPITYHQHIPYLLFHTKNTVTDIHSRPWPNRSTSIQVMPSIAGNKSSPLAAAGDLKDTKSVTVGKSGDIRSGGDSTPRKRRLRSHSAEDDAPITPIPSPGPISPTKWKSPRRCANGSPNVSTVLRLH